MLKDCNLQYLILGHFGMFHSGKKSRHLISFEIAHFSFTSPVRTSILFALLKPAVNLEFHIFLHVCDNWWIKPMVPFKLQIQFFSLVLCLLIVIILHAKKLHRY